MHPNKEKSFLINHLDFICRRFIFRHVFTKIRSHNEIVINHEATTGTISMPVIVIADLPVYRGHHQVLLRVHSRRPEQGMHNSQVGLLLLMLLVRTREQDWVGA
jgi:hypothetical protein